MGAMRNSLRNGLRFAKTSPGITAVAAFTKIGFGQSFAIGAYAFVPILLKDLLALVMFWAHPPGGGRLRSPSISSLAAYLPAHSPAWLASVGGNLDISIFWTIGLLAVGYAAASSKKVRFGSALAVVVIGWFTFLPRRASPPASPPWSRGRKAGDSGGSAARMKHNWRAKRQN
jgi:hypothetical protein